MLDQAKTLSSAVVSERARRLIEDLHDPLSNEERWWIAEQALREERDEAYLRGMTDATS